MCIDRSGQAPGGAAVGAGDHCPWDGKERTPGSLNRGQGEFMVPPSTLPETDLSVTATLTPTFLHNAQGVAPQVEIKGKPFCRILVTCAETMHYPQSSTW